ncbi:methyltransferase, FkbM family [Saccharomonospora marina XMU15]|uniref:Methyltransferase, FkbM family n=1 Tax=Saccharomonospora marina XMU15 TaxID=882083 RepID=H5WYT3_9PSEU|nr:methyltransferase, FkbM family [Saccharomonospora marina XMU15]
MSRLRKAAAATVDTCCTMFGRRPVIRAARFVLNRARLDHSNHAASNGEYALQKWLLSSEVPSASPITVLDVGANVGKWSNALLENAARLCHGTNVDLHAFEPSSYTYEILTRNLPSHVRVNQLALSSAPGKATLHVIHPGAGTNSLHRESIGAEDLSGEEVVEMATIDDYLREHDIAKVRLLKIDTEGNDLAVLEGAARSLQDGAVDVVQFEYNHRWIASRRFLKDAFDLLTPLGYRIGKLTRHGVEGYPGWHPELETFIEGNYVAARPDVLQQLPRIDWWKL